MAGPLTPLVAVIGAKAVKAWLRTKDKRIGGKFRVDDETPPVHHSLYGIAGASAVGATAKALDSKSKKRAKKKASPTAGPPKPKNKKPKPPGLIKNKRASSIVRRKK
jgi:hypothetical protein